MSNEEEVLDRESRVEELEGSIQFSCCRPRLARDVRLHWNAAGKQFVLLFPEGELALNATAVAVLELCDGKRTVEAIATELEERYRKANVGNEVCYWLSQLAERRLLDVGQF